MDMFAQATQQETRPPTNGGLPSPRRAGSAAAPATDSTPDRHGDADAQKQSVDPMRATDRYRLVMPWSSRV